MKAKEQGTEEQRNRNRRDRKKEHSNLFACKKKEQEQEQEQQKEQQKEQYAKKQEKTRYVTCGLVVAIATSIKHRYPDTQIIHMLTNPSTLQPHIRNI